MIHKISLKACKDTTLNLSDLAVLDNISKYAKGDKTEYRYITNIAEATGLKDKAIDECLARLRDKGYITTKKVKVADYNTRNTYTLHERDQFVLVNEVEGLTYKELALLLRLKANAYDNGNTITFKTKKRLCEWVGLDFRTIKPLLASLEAKGFISQNKGEIVIISEIFNDYRKDESAESVKELDNMIADAIYMLGNNNAENFPVAWRIYDRERSNGFKNIRNLKGFTDWVKYGTRYINKTNDYKLTI
jgi:DNA-binding MarR family transcriptional regulator